MVARAFQTTGALIVCFVFYLAWFLTGKPVITTNYVAELNRIVRPVADDSLNAAPLYHKAAKLYEKVPEDISKLLGKKYREAAVEEKQLIEKWIKENGEALDLIIAGSQKPYYWQEYRTKREESGMMGVLIPHLSEFRKLAFTFRWRAQLRAEQGRYEEAFGDIKSCYRLGRHLRGDKTLIEQLVGIAIEAMAVQTIRDILIEHRIDSPILAELQQSFEKMIADENRTVSFKFEKLTLYDEIQRCFTEDRFGGGHLCLRGRGLQRLIALVGSSSDVFEIIFREKGWAAAPHVLFTHPNKQETREMADRYYAFWDKIVQKTPAQIRSERIDTEKEAMEIIKGNLLLEILTPAIGRVSEISYRNRADVEAVLTIIAILRYEQDSGGYPQNLKQLMADDYLKQLPLDPFSEKPFVYKRTDDNFILYSVGRNFTDDGGEYGKDRKGKPRLWYSLDGDAVFWPVPRSKVR